jgi:hypothetical protein
MIVRAADAAWCNQRVGIPVHPGLLLQSDLRALAAIFAPNCAFYHGLIICAGYRLRSVAQIQTQATGYVAGEGCHRQNQKRWQMTTKFAAMIQQRATRALSI